MEQQHMMRLQKFMALAGVASRRKSEELILQGRVKINGLIVNTLGVKINTKKDTIEVNGEIVDIKNEKLYIMLHKPVGYVSTVSDQFDRNTVIDLIKEDIDKRLYPVGRLDYDTEGLLLLTNDGNLTYRMTHPKHKIHKTYLATVKGIPTRAEMKTFRNGLSIEDYITSPASIEITRIMKGSSELKIIIHEGRNRQVRKMCTAIGHPVINLKRIAVGNICLGHLPKGRWRHLKPAEIKGLFNL